MNLIDIVIIIVLIWFAVSGYRKGLIVSLASLAALVLGIYVAMYFSDITAGLIQDIFAFDSKYLMIIAFVVTFVLVVALVITVGRIVEEFVDLLLLGFLNKLSGALFGILKGALILSLIIWVMNYFEFGENLIGNQSRESSMFYRHVEKIAPQLYDRMEFLHDMNIKDPFATEEDTPI